jgi:hypothetical protein
MALLSGNNGKIEIGGKAVAAVTNFSIEITSDTLETSTMGTDVRTYIKGLSSWNGSADVMIEFDPTLGNLGTGTNAISALNGTAGLVGDTATTFTAYMDSVGSPSGKKWVGNVIITGFTQEASMDGMITGSISFQGTGPITYTA